MAELTEDEQRAIDQWLAKNTPTRFPTGYSSIFDEFGNKRSSLKFRMAGIAKRVRTLLKKQPDLTHDEIARNLVLPKDDVVAVCKKHNIKVKA